jgi:hypothetical protein
LNTVTVSVPALLTSAAVIAAVSFVPLTKVVVRLDPFHFTTEVETKLVPFTVRVKAELPLIAPLGAIVVIAGTGLLMVKVSEPDDPPPGDGLNTVTAAVPAEAMSEARI